MTEKTESNSRAKLYIIIAIAALFLFCCCAPIFFVPLATGGLMPENLSRPENLNNIALLVSPLACLVVLIGFGFYGLMIYRRMQNGATFSEALLGPISWIIRKNTGNKR